MPELFDAYDGRIKRFWRFGGYSAFMLAMFHDVHTRNESGIEGQSRRFQKIKKIIDFSKRQKERGPDSFKILSDVHSGLIDVKYDDRCSLRISSLSPSSSLAETYTSYVGRCLKELRGERRRFTFEWDDFDAAPNLVSTILWVEFGHTRLLFGSDAVREVWEEVCESEERKNATISLNCHFVKVSHHGSEGAYHENSWKEITAQALPDAVVTPFTRCGLPRNEGLNLLKDRCRKLFLTAPGQNFSYYPTKTLAPIKKHNWKQYTANGGCCMFEFDSEGNLTNSVMSDTAVCFQGELGDE